MSTSTDLLISLMSEEDVTEDLRDWFGKGKKGGIGGGGWDRYNTKGERIGKCAAPERGADEGKPKCLSKEKAAQLRAKGGKKAIANAVKRKKAQDPITDRPGTGNAPKYVSNRIKEDSDDNAPVFTPEFEEVLHEKNVPTNPGLWSRAKSEAKKRFDVYPSAYANGWAAKWYKEHGGGWRTEKTESNTPSDREWGTKSLVNIYKKDTPGELDEFFGINFKEVGPELVNDFKKATPGQTEAVCMACHESFLVDEPMPSATYMCQTCEAAMHQQSSPSSLHEVAEVKHFIAAKKHDKTVDMYVSSDQPRLMKMFGTWKASGNLYDRIAQGEMPATLPAAKIRQRMAQQFGVPMEKIEIHFLDNTAEAWERNPNCQQCGKKLSPQELNRGDRVCQACVKQNKGRVWGTDADDEYVDEATKPFTQGEHVVLLAVPKNPEVGDGKGYWKVGAEVYRAPVKNVLFDVGGAPMDKRWESSFTHFVKNFDSVLSPYYKKAPTWTADLHENMDTDLDIIFEAIAELHEAAEYQGRKVKLGKPFRTPNGPKKFSVYVKNDKGNVVKVNFGDPKMEIKRDDPERRKNFRARHNCDNPGPRWKARYWSCRWGWGQKKLSA